MNITLGTVLTTKQSLVNENFRKIPNIAIHSGDVL